MKLSRIVALLATAFAAALALPSPAQAATYPFYAHSGDQCVYGFTRGSVSTTTPTPVPGVLVTGSLTDRPTPIDPVLCRDDGLFSVAAFTAFTANGTIARDAVRADNSTLQYRFVLGSNTSTDRIVRINIQVCRYHGTSSAPRYCGATVQLNLT
jgi:hypothetical protein